MRVMNHRHSEAYCLMTYVTDDGAERERIWNSRDGVTPFVIRSRGGREMSHVDWHDDEYHPDYRPQPGERIFVDLTPEAASERARSLVERYWNDPDYPMALVYPSPETAIEALSVFDPGTPMLVEVGAAIGEGGV